MKNEKIDFVITWVDGSDTKWLKEKNKYLSEENKEDIDSSSARYRNWGTLKYLFRGIEKYAPWVNKVFLVTNGQCPQWLNLNCEKLRLIKHEEFIPKEYLPTFSSHPIELNLHRIDELSENYVMFNDDMFIINKLDSEDFFKNNKPCDSAVLSPIITSDDSTFPHILINNMRIINKHFDKREVMKKHKWKFINLKYGVNVLRTIFVSPWKSFVGFYNPHLPYSFKKSVLSEIWEKEFNELDSTSKRKFRNHYYDVSPWLLRYWQLASGNFIPRRVSIGKKVNYEHDGNEKIYDIIKMQKYKLICLNDDDLTINFDFEKKQTINAFETIFPQKSNFEK